MNKLISMANNKNGTENVPPDCPKKKSPANTTAKLPEKKNDTAKIQPKQNYSKKSQNELRSVFRVSLLFRLQVLAQKVFEEVQWRILVQRLKFKSGPEIYIRPF